MFIVSLLLYGESEVQQNKLPEVNGLTGRDLNLESRSFNLSPLVVNPVWG